MQPHESISPPASAPSTILLVEDDEGVAVLERRCLERHGFRVITVGSAPEALSMLDRNSFDLVVMDYRLPDETTGLELFGRMQALGYAMPVVMVTGFSNEATVIEALRWGVRDFVPKTAEYLDYLPIAVERALKTFRTEKKLVESEDALRVREEQLRQALKMEAIGQLAGGVAHDFNNLLTVILGYSDMLLQENPPENSTSNEALLEIHRAAERAAGLTRQLLAFSRKQVLEPKTINLNEVASGMVKMLHRLIGEDVRVRTVLTPNLAPVFADPGQLEQVLMNLAVNARDAMPDGGELGIETANVELGEDYAASHADMKPGQYVMLAVDDSGCGMDAATQARIFEPFFTTKEMGKGTGLGLATVYGIVKQSGGHIWVYSEIGLGTTFKIYLPAVAAPNSPTGAPGAGRGNLAGTETVLLVEDEEGVRGMIRTALQSFGYTVLEAAHPLEAIRISQTHDGSIDLLLTDVVMPQVNGRRLAELLQPERPDMAVIYISGYSGDAIARNGILNAEVNFLQKPFSPAALAQRVRETLQAGRRRRQSDVSALTVSVPV